ncbi:hypothetical protein N657DRAFT_321772 [Parathielavia appendiculata]|uniref:Uncharacterized protein n=1 Tax=Parathielavia appendiculata TaxID=2587402 RepID=A0AAN6YYM7_9PEZI|nr:hypothetical protein N657DRAFT_321772 [Parathielavia appendiculata]
MKANLFVPITKNYSGGVTIGSGAVIGACSLVKRDIPPMSVAYGTPARVVALLKDIKPTPPGSAVAAETMEDAVGLGNRLPLVQVSNPTTTTTTTKSKVGFRHGHGHGGLGFGLGRGLEAGEEELEEEGFRDGVVDREEEEADTLDLVLPSLRSPLIGSVRSGSSSTATGGRGNSAARRMALADRLRLGEAREVRSLLLEGRREQRRIRRFKVEAVAIITVLVTLLMAVFFAGLYLGASRLLILGSD